MTTLVLFHGAHRFEGPVEIRRGRPSRVEHGPGFYLTTSVETARKYAKGGGKVLRVELEAPLRFLGDTWTSLPEAEAFVKGLSRLPKRAEILSDLQRSAARRKAHVIPLSVVNNLFVNHLVAGRFAPELAAFYRKHGADAEIERKSGEDWLVLVNPEKVVSIRPATPSEQVDAPLFPRPPSSL